MRGKINTNDSFIQKLQSDVEKYKTNPERRKELMNYQMKLDDMRYVGEKTGKEEERIDAIKKDDPTLSSIQRWWWKNFKSLNSGLWKWFFSRRNKAVY